ncbi:MAG: hypothetical protein IH946_02435, partial [Bacteroidetes bacterium]|nr:hypothetical protein [Bacteroidota bacterium]
MPAVKEVTIEQKLKSLWNLQMINSKIDEIQVLKGELPIEVADLEDELEGLETRIVNIQEEIKEIKASVTEFRSKKKEAEEMIEKYEKQQSNVKNNRE